MDQVNECMREQDELKIRRQFRVYRRYIYTTWRLGLRSSFTSNLEFTHIKQKIYICIQPGDWVYAAVLPPISNSRKLQIKGRIWGLYLGVLVEPSRLSPFMSSNYVHLVLLIPHSATHWNNTHQIPNF